MFCDGDVRIRDSVLFPFLKWSALHSVQGEFGLGW